MASRSANTEPREQVAGVPASETILVGIVLRPQALHGEVRIQIHSDVPDRFDPGRELWLRVGDGTPRRAKVASFRPIRGGGIVRFEGYRDRNQAEALRGARLEVSETDVPPAPEGLYYHFQLIGCRCIDARDGDLGEVTELVEDGGGLLLEVVQDGRVLSIPFVEPFLTQVDVENRQIRFQLPPGLIETCASKS
ncbi:MAG: ribosome maturation factor RimM [Acidobacteriota bacterium]